MWSSNVKIYGSEKLSGLILYTFRFFHIQGVKMENVNIIVTALMLSQKEKRFESRRKSGL